MTQSEKLDALIHRSIEHGFSIRYYEVKECSGWLDGKQQTEPYILQSYNADTVFEREIAYQVVIFNHDFAKALFGEEYMGRPVTIQYGTKKLPKEAHFFEDAVTWQYHLQQAVIANNPIDYMYKEVFGK